MLGISSIELKHVSKPRCIGVEAGISTKHSGVKGRPVDNGLMSVHITPFDDNTLYKYYPQQVDCV